MNTSHNSTRNVMAAPFAVVLVLHGLLFARSSFGLSFRLVEEVLRLNTTILPLTLALSAMYGLACRRKAPGRRGLLLLSVGYLCAAFGLTVLGIHAFHIEPYRLVLREVTLESGKVDRPLRILHVSDIQAAEIGEYERQAFATMSNIDVDLIVHTGDMLQPHPPATFASEYPKLLRLFGTVDPALGVFGVYGNTDMPFHARMEASSDPIRLLENEQQVLSFGETTIRILGLSHDKSRFPEKARDALADWIGDAGTNDVTILLGHSPEFAVAAQAFPFDLCLAGHTHGGQIRVPFWGALYTSTFYIPRSWALGWRKIGRSRLNVSGGIGSERAEGISRIRINCPPEMTLITIVPVNTGKQTGNRPQGSDQSPPGVTVTSSM